MLKNSKHCGKLRENLQVICELIFQFDEVLLHTKVTTVSPFTKRILHS